MPRLRFSTDMLFGLLIGLALGAFMALVAFPRSAADGGATSVQVEELSRKLDTAYAERARVDQQLEQLQKLAQQMTTNFNNLEVKFRALADERERDARPAAAPPVVP